MHPSPLTEAALNRTRVRAPVSIHKNSKDFNEALTVGAEWNRERFERAGRLWRRRYSTRDIAVLMEVDEAEVWNRLDPIKSLAKSPSVGAQGSVRHEAQPRLASGPNSDV